MFEQLWIYQRPGWPRFYWDGHAVGACLAQLRHEQGVLSGMMARVGRKLNNEALVQTYTEDVVRSSEIEGEKLDHQMVYSSVAHKLGLDTGGMVQATRDVDGVVDMVLDATQNYDQPLTDERLFSWHALLFPSGRSGFNRITVGAWRQGAMRVVSGAIGRERIHFEAPPPEVVAYEMQGFLAWYNTDSDLDLVLKSGIAHIWFETIHPFDDGNGRIGRALCDLLLARSENSPQRYYSLSAEIMVQRSEYYQHLERASKGGLDITEWLVWYLGCLRSAIASAQVKVKTILAKADFWNQASQYMLNERQNRMLNLMLDGEFYGVLTSSKWAKICKCSQDTAQRDINDLLAKGLLSKNAAGGRAASYALAAV